MYFQVWRVVSIIIRGKKKTKPCVWRWRRILVSAILWPEGAYVGITVVGLIMKRSLYDLKLIDIVEWTIAYIKVLPNARIVLNAVALYHAVLFYSQDDNGRLSGEFHTTRDMHAYSRQCFGGKREEIMEDKTRERPVAGWCYSWWLQELYWHFPHQSSNKVWDFLCPHDPLVVLPQGLNFVEHR